MAKSVEAQLSLDLQRCWPSDLGQPTGRKPRAARRSARIEAATNARVPQSGGGAMNSALVPNPSASGLANLGQIRSFPKHAVILAEGHAGDSFYAILSGRVKVFLSDEQGREIFLGTCGPGDFLGEMALDGGPRSASVMRLEPSCFSVVARDSLRSAIATDPDNALKLLSTVISRARANLRGSGTCITGFCSPFCPRATALAPRSTSPSRGAT
jgi:CRP-like cAMP-binding protein